MLYIKGLLSDNVRYTHYEFRVGLMAVVWWKRLIFLYCNTTQGKYLLESCGPWNEDFVFLLYLAGLNLMDVLV